MSKITKKQLQQSIDLLNKENSSQHAYLMRIKRALKSIDIDILSNEFDESKPQLKQLDQSVFDGLDEKWRFAAVDADGSANGFDIRVYPRGGDEYGLFAYESDYANSDDNSVHIGKGYDTTDWQNSLIERDTAKELLEVDLSSELTGSELCKAMLARGDKYISGFGHHHSDALALESKFADTVSKHTQCFQSSQNAWDYFVPINNQGEPLTAAEAGL